MPVQFAEIVDGLPFPHRHRQVAIAINPAVFSVQKVGRNPIPENGIKADGIAGLLQIGVNAGNIIGRFGDQGAQGIGAADIILAVMLGQIVHKEGGRAIVGGDMGIVQRPMHQGNVGLAHKPFHTVVRIAGGAHRQFRQPLVDPGSLGGVIVPVDGVQQFVGQDAAVGR